MKTFPVVEIFGSVSQGEGALIGHSTHFVRFGGCDYKCGLTAVNGVGLWCDSWYAVDPELVRQNSTKMTVDEIVNRVEALPPAEYVTLSGGNPALHELDDLRVALQESGYLVAVETQGSIYRDWLEHVDTLTVSPKPPSSKMTTDFVQLDKFYQLRWNERLNFKVVVFDDVDFEYAKMIYQKYPAVPFYLQVGNEVGKNTLQDLVDRLRWLTEKTLADRHMTTAIVLPQLHVLMYGNKRGV